MSELSLKEVKSISPNKLLSIINKGKEFLKTNEVWKNICKDNDESVDIIDLIPTMFGDLDVSAKTDHGIVIINYKLLCDNDFKDDYSYLIHEYVHWFQQCYSNKPTESSDDESYLHNKYEQEGFANQIKYIAEQNGEEEAIEYVNDLLDHHEITNNKEKDKLEAILLEKL